MTDQITSPTEGPSGHEAAPVDDRKVPWRVFLFVGGFVAFMGVVYWAASYEEAGVVMLMLAAALSLWVAAYLWLQQRGHDGERIEATDTARDVVAAEGRAEPGTGSGEHGHYLPHASAWPFAIGLGGATLGNGLVLGLWVIVPGLALLALGLGGFVRQTRRRD